MKYSYKAALVFSIIVNIIGGCGCDKNKPSKKNQKKEKIEETTQNNLANTPNTSEENDPTQNKPNNTPPKEPSNGDFERIWAQWLNKDGQPVDIKDAIQGIIKVILPSKEKQDKMYTEFYEPQLNILSKALIKEYSAYKQQLKDLFDQWPSSQKEKFCTLTLKQEEVNMPKNLLSLATDDDKKKLEQLKADYQKKKEKLLIDFIKNSEIVEKMPREFQEAIPEGIKKYQEKIKQPIEHIQNDGKKDPEKTVDERFEAIFDNVIFKDWLKIKIRNIIDLMPLSEEERDKIYNNFYASLLKADSIDDNVKLLEQFFRSHVENIKKYCYELPIERRETFVNLHEKARGYIPKLYFKLAEDVQKKKNMANLVIKNTEAYFPLLIACIQNPKIVEKMPDTVKKALPEGIKRYKEKIEKDIEELRKY